MRPEFLLYSFQSKFLTDQFDAMGSGSTVKHLPLPACRSFRLRLPPIEVQSVFADRLAVIRLLEERGSESLDMIDALFASLQHRAFGGEL